MVKWEVMCRPKNLGGIINTPIMNKCLIIKWWRRILSIEPSVLWFGILKAKYFPTSSPLFASAISGSQFWHQVVKVRDDLRSLVKFNVGEGVSVHFWLDWWHGDRPLCLSFLVLFSYCSIPAISITDLSRRNWDLGVRRVPSPKDLEDWHRLVT